MGLSTNPGLLILIPQSNITCYNITNCIFTLGNVGGGPIQRGGCLVMGIPDGLQTILHSSPISEVPYVFPPYQLRALDKILLRAGSEYGEEAH